MRRNPASQILHADTVDLLEETLAKKLPLFTHIPDNYHYPCHKQHADKYPDRYAQLEHSHLCRLSLNLHFLTKHYRILPVTHIQFGNTHLYPFAPDGIVQMAITFQVFIGTAIITGMLKIMLQILIAYSQHIGVKMPHRSSPGDHSLRLGYITFLQCQFNHLGFNVMNSRVMLYIGEETITFVQADLCGVQFVSQQVQFSQVYFNKVLFKHHLRIRRYECIGPAHIFQSLLIVFPVIIMVAAIVEIGPLLAHVHFIEELPGQFIVMIG